MREGDKDAWVTSLWAESRTQGGGSLTQPSGGTFPSFGFTRMASGILRHRDHGERQPQSLSIPRASRPIRDHHHHPCSSWYPGNGT